MCKLFRLVTLTQVFQLSDSSSTLSPAFLPVENRGNFFVSTRCPPKMMSALTLKTLVSSLGICLRVDSWRDVKYVPLTLVANWMQELTMHGAHNLDSNVSKVSQRKELLNGYSDGMRLGIDQ